MPGSAFPVRWRVVLIKRENGLMSQEIVAEKLTKSATRRAMWSHYRVACTNYSINWTLIDKIKQADQCKLLFRDNAGKPVRHEYLVQKA